MAVQGLRFRVTPTGPFDLFNQNQYFNGWPTIDGAVAMTFPVEGWRTTASVLLEQEGGDITGEVHGASGPDAEKAWHQALAAISLDFDGTGYARVGDQDPVIGALQKQYKYLRPSLFHSPYEAAAGFTIGHRIQINQARKIRHQMAETSGEAVEVAGQTLHGFPRPQQLKKIDDFTGLSSIKIERLHAIADAALEGWLDRDNLRAMPYQAAIEKLSALPGIGPFFAQGILTRGAGLTDSFTDDDFTVKAVKTLCDLPDEAGLPEVLKRVEAWRPYRMWCAVLVHVQYRNQPGVSQGSRGGGRSAAEAAGRKKPGA
jgi:DNA-3-methyladenine glycosylase II